MGLNINKKYDKTYKYYNAKHNITRMLRYTIFILFVLITFIKNVDDFAAITNMYDYIRMQNITIKIDTIIFKTIVILSLSRINNAI